MKILSAGQIKALDKHTIEHEPISSIDLMERAAKAVFEAFSAHIKKHQSVYVFCGMGNNGGDGLAIARMLIKDGFHSVYPFIIRHSPGGSPGFKMNEERLKFLVPIHYIESAKQLPKIEKNAIIIDAIFGSGLSRPVDGISGDVIWFINQLKAKVIAVDVPSGMFCDKLNEADDIVIHSTLTYTFHAPKLTFLFPQSEKYVPVFNVLDIGLSVEYEAGIDAPFSFIDESLVKSIFKKRSKFSHKGSYGHALICAGSYGKMGAAVLSVQAALRSGAGLVTANIPKSGYGIIQISCPEAMVIADENEGNLTHHLDYSKFSALGIGPGIDAERVSVEFIETILSTANKPMVIDADALNIISANRYLRDKIPGHSVLTPHPGEFKRLAGDWENDLQKLEKQIEFTKQYNVVTVVKGAHTSVSVPGGKVYFNGTGNAGMAKGGSGDALTGVITALLAQGYTADLAAVIGVYIHGLAGDLAAEHIGLTGMTARDLIHYLPIAFARFE